MGSPVRLPPGTVTLGKSHPLAHRRLVVQEIPDRSEQVGHAGDMRIDGAFDRAHGHSFENRNQEGEVVLFARA